MAWIGKIVGAILGYAAYRLIGAVVGIILGHQFDRGMAGKSGPRRSSGTHSSYGPSAVQRQRIFFESTFLVMGHLAKADGRVSEMEISAARAWMQRMRLDQRGTRLAMELFNTGKRPDYPVDQQLEQLRRTCGQQPELLRTFLEIQLDMALVKGSVSPAERELLGRMADRLGINRLALAHLEALMRARRSYGPDSGQARWGQPGYGMSSGAGRDNGLEKAYAVLGVERSASDAEVKTAYRRLMNQHHPDKQAARGLPDAMLELAKERTREILAAYETIKEQRGLK